MKIKSIVCSLLWMSSCFAPEDFELQEGTTHEKPSKEPLQPRTTIKVINDHTLSESPTDNAHVHSTSLDHPNSLKSPSNDSFSDSYRKALNGLVEGANQTQSAGLDLSSDTTSFEFPEENSTQLRSQKKLEKFYGSRFRLFKSLSKLINDSPFRNIVEAPHKEESANTYVMRMTQKYQKTVKEKKPQFEAQFKQYVKTIVEHEFLKEDKEDRDEALKTLQNFRWKSETQLLHEKIFGDESSDASSQSTISYADVDKSIIYSFHTLQESLEVAGKHATFNQTPSATENLDKAEKDYFNKMRTFSLLEDVIPKEFPQARYHNFEAHSQSVPVRTEGDYTDYVKQVLYNANEKGYNSGELLTVITVLKDLMSVYRGQENALRYLKEEEDKIIYS